MKKNIIVLVVFLLLVSLLIAAGTVKIRRKILLGLKTRFISQEMFI